MDIRRKLATFLAPAVLVLPSACASDDGGTRQEPPAEYSTSAAEKGSRTKPEPSPFCAEVERRVMLTYTIHARPTMAGQELWVTLRVRNGLPRRLGFQIGGVVAVTEASDEGRDPLLQWGGSSADITTVDGGTEHTLPVVAGSNTTNGWVDGPLPVPEGARVSGVAAFVDIGRCDLAARLNAPGGLVVGHPESSWMLPPAEEASRQHNAIIRRVIRESR